MADVQKLSPLILKWFTVSLLYTGQQVQDKQLALNSCLERWNSGQHGFNSALMQEIYQHFLDGIAVMCVLRLHIDDPQFRPDPAMMFQYPINKMEIIHNLQHI